MGSILVKDGRSVVFLTTWSAGSDLPLALHGALARRQRWNDGPYLARVVFCSMILRNESPDPDLANWNFDGDLGYGISARLEGAGDAAHPVIMLDIQTQTVAYITVEDAARVAEDSAFAATPLPAARWTISEYITGRREHPRFHYQYLSQQGRFHERDA